LDENVEKIFKMVVFPECLNIKAHGSGKAIKLKGEKNT